MKAMFAPLSSLLQVAQESRGLLDAACRAGILDPTSSMAAAAGLAAWGASPAAGYAAAALRFPHRAAVVDDEGQVTFAELARRMAKSKR